MTKSPSYVEFTVTSDDSSPGLHGEIFVDGVQCARLWRDSSLNDFVIEIYPPVGTDSYLLTVSDLEAAIADAITTLRKVETARG